MSSSYFDEMFEFLSEYKYEIIENVPDNLKCGKCKIILIKPYCVPCGCAYCLDCVEEMLNNGVKNCFGETEYCKDVLISNNQVDYGRNREISNVVMKCPKEMCLYKCAIINMKEHVRVCENKNVKCPFGIIVCEGNKILREMLNDNCQSPNCNHCKILIKILDKINKLETRIDNKIKRENARMKIEKDEQNQECDEINENSESKILVAKIPSIKWRIDKSDEKKKQAGIIWSEYFTEMLYEYKLRLLFSTDACSSDIKKKSCSIYLWIFSGEKDQFLSWPFKAKVTIKIMSKTCPSINQSITKDCKIDRSINNFPKVSEPFIYSYSDLTKYREMLDNCFFVECFIDFD